MSVEILKKLGLSLLEKKVGGMLVFWFGFSLWVANIPLTKPFFSSNDMMNWSDILVCTYNRLDCMEFES